jgi:hypothetical protein
MSTVRPNFQNMLAQRLGMGGAPGGIPPRYNPAPFAPAQPVGSPPMGGPVPYQPISSPVGPAQPVGGPMPYRPAPFALPAPPVGPVARPIGAAPNAPLQSIPAPVGNPADQNMLRQRMGLA